MTPVTGLLAAERNLGDIHDKRSGTGDDQESRSQRLAAIAAYYKEATEATRRCLSQPTVERATVSVVGFRVDCDSAEGSCSTAYRQVHAMAFATGLSLLPDTSQAMDSNKPAGPRLSESETPLSERSDGSLFFSQDASEAALNCTLESIRQKLQDRADGKTSPEPPAAQGCSSLRCHWLPVRCLLVVTHLLRMSTESG